ncbi:MAG: 4Fe-4S dicluster domain-containing protein [Candidatus Helarchaeota archaeon]
MNEFNTTPEFTECLTEEDLDPNFKHEIAAMPDGKTILACYQCGTCSSSCPITCVAEFAPSQIIRMALLGLKKPLLESEAINSVWLCATCGTCIERCPQGVEVTNVLHAIKNYIFKTLQKIPKGLKVVSETIVELGRSIEISDFQEDERDDLDLPAVPEADVESVRTILKDTEIGKRFMEKEE